MASEEFNQKTVRRLWGSDEAFYKELERFHEQRKAATVISYDNETGLPLEAVYRFQPVEIFKEQRALIQAIADQHEQSGREG